MCRAPAAFYRNKQAVRCSAEKLIPRDSDVIMETNKAAGAAAFWLWKPGQCSAHQIEKTYFHRESAGIFKALSTLGVKSLA